jgi:hypothetical protein
MRNTGSKQDPSRNLHLAFNGKRRAGNLIIKQIDKVYTSAYNAFVQYEWDDDKNRINYRRHGVWFEEAQTIWADQRSMEFYDPEHSIEESRYIRVGLSSKLRILLVVFCERPEGEVIRIISARRATSNEVLHYEKRIRSD